MIESAVIGVVLSISGNICINIGSNLIADAHCMIESKRKEGALAMPVYRSLMWSCGASLFGIGNILNFISFGFAAQTLLACLSSIQFISNILFARIIHGKPFSRRILISTGMLLTGILSILLFQTGSSSSDSVSAALLVSRLFDPGFTSYVVCTIVLAAAIQAYVYILIKPRLRFLLDKVQQLQDQHANSVSGNNQNQPDLETETHEAAADSNSEAATENDIHTASFATLAMHVSRIPTRVIAAFESDTKVLRRKQWTVTTVLYVMQSATIGSYSVLLAKSVSSLLRETFVGENQFQFAAIYIILLLWVSSMAFWLRRMNISLRIFDSVSVIPTLQVFWIIFSIISGGLFFGEFTNFSPGGTTAFLIGVLLILAGVLLLTNQHEHEANSYEAHPRDVCGPRSADSSESSYSSQDAYINVLFQSNLASRASQSSNSSIALPYASPLYTVRGCSVTASQHKPPL